MARVSRETVSVPFADFASEVSKLAGSRPRSAGEKSSSPSCGRENLLIILRISAK